MLVIMKTIAEKVVADFTNESVTDMYEINKGAVNNIYVISTPSSKFIVRIDPGESNSNRFKKEAWCIKQAKAVGVYGPEILKIDVKDRHPYMLSKFIEGFDGEDENTVPKKKIWFTLGQYAKKIYSIKVDGFGESMLKDGVFCGSWKKYLTTNLESLEAGDELPKSIQEKSSKLKDAFLKLRDIDFTFGLTHNDLSLKNTIVGKDGNIYLIDWGSTEVHIVPHMDISEILNSSLKSGSSEFKAFLEGSNLSGVSFEKIEEEIHMLRLLVYTDKLRWAQDNNSERVRNFTDRLVSEIELI